MFIAHQGLSNPISEEQLISELTSLLNSSLPKLRQKVIDKVYQECFGYMYPAEFWADGKAGSIFIKIEKSDLPSFYMITLGGAKVNTPSQNILTEMKNTDQLRTIFMSLNDLF